MNELPHITPAELARVTIKNELEYIDSNPAMSDLDRFLHCDGKDKRTDMFSKATSLYKDYLGLFGFAHRGDGTEAPILNDMVDYIHFSNVLRDAMTVRAVADGVKGANLNGLHGSLSIPDKKAKEYRYSYHLPTEAGSYWYMLHDSWEYLVMKNMFGVNLIGNVRNIDLDDEETCLALYQRGNPLPVQIASARDSFMTEIKAGVLTIKADSLMGVYNLLVTLHLVDVQQVCDGIPKLVSHSYASSLWLLMAESYRDGDVAICEFCKRPFIAKRSSGAKKRTCSGSCRTRLSKRDSSKR